MSQDQADRNMLFGILAVQLGFIRREQLVSAMTTWVIDKTRSIGEILQSQKAIDTAVRTSLTKDVEKQLSIFGDPAKALAAVGPPAPLVEALSQIIDVHVAASVGQVSGRFADQFATRAGFMSGSVAEPASSNGRFDQSGATFADQYATRGALPPPKPPRTELEAATYVGIDDTGPTSSPSSFGGGPTASRFKVLRSHARGGLGEVFVAKDEELNREVALKEIQNLHADHPESRTRFMLEAEITGALEHPGIVPVYGLGQYQDGRPYYAMRFIRGDSLQDAITEFHAKEKPERDPGERAIALRGLLRRFIDVCHAIAYAHSRGVIHRDIKPGNVMLGQFGETLVVDWGLAKPLGAATPPDVAAPEATIMPQSFLNSTPTYVGLAVGTPQYMSPEQAAGRVDELSPATDTYSLGATLYCLLTGKAPFEGGGDIGMLLSRVQRGEFRPPKEVNAKTPPALDAICVKAMANRAEDRYATPKELAGDIERWLADEPTTAWKEPWIIRARRWANRHRTGVTSAVAGLAVAGISLGIATVLLTAANAREREAKNEAREQRDEAARNYQMARRAVDRYHTEVSEDVLLNEPGMEPLRHKLLQAAREFYTQFANQKANDPNVKAELGRAFYRLAMITADIESPKKSVELQKQALDIFNELTAAKPDDRDVQFDKAVSLHQLGRIQRDLDELGASRKAYESALAIWTSLSEANAGEAKYTVEEARTRHGLAGVDQVLRKLEPSRTQFSKALEMREVLVKSQPQRPDYTRDLAVTRHNLAMVQAGEGSHGPAEENYRLALEAQEKLAKNAPNVTQYQADVARTHTNLADLNRLRGMNAEAIAEFESAVAGWAKLAKEHPTVGRFSAGHARSLLGLCMAQRAAMELPAAAESLKQAHEIYKRLSESGTILPYDRSAVATGQRQMGNVYRTIGKMDEARAALQKSIDLMEPLARGEDALPEYSANLARALHDLGFLLRGEKKKAEAELALRRALGIWETLVTAHPENIDYAAGLAVTRRILGEMARDDDRKIAAIEMFGDAIAVLTNGPPDRAQTAESRFELRNAHLKRAETFAVMDRHADAEPDWERVVELSTGGDLIRARLGRAVTLAHLGQYARAGAEADAVISLAKTTAAGEPLYQLGVIYALAAGSASADRQLASDEQKRQSEDFAAKAIEQLRRAKATGYFKIPTNREKLERGEELKFIRSREGFAELLHE